MGARPGREPERDALRSPANAGVSRESERASGDHHAPVHAAEARSGIGLLRSGGMPSAGMVMALQRTVGNASTVQLLQAGAASCRTFRRKSRTRP